jgi:cytosine/adenosine deaminase-related metal-dependent hydrolase
MSLTQKTTLMRVMDGAINGDSIARIAEDIALSAAIQIIDAKGMIVTRGSIAIHFHSFFGTQPGQGYSNGFSALPPDGITLLKSGNDLRIVQVFAGHKSPSATEKYRQTQVEELKQQIVKHHPLG